MLEPEVFDAAALYAELRHRSPGTTTSIFHNSVSVETHTSAGTILVYADVGNRTAGVYSDFPGDYRKFADVRETAAYMLRRVELEARILRRPGLQGYPCFLIGAAQGSTTVYKRIARNIYTGYKELSGMPYVPDGDLVFVRRDGKVFRADGETYRAWSC